MENAIKGKARKMIASSPPKQPKGSAAAIAAGSSGWIGTSAKPIGSFTIPKKKAAVNENATGNVLRQVPTNAKESREFDEIQSVIYRHCHHQSSAQTLKLNTCYIIQNPVLNKKFEARRQRMRATSQYTTNNFNISYGFLSAYTLDQAKQIGTDGLKAGHTVDGTLGDNEKGVHLSRHADILDGGALTDSVGGYMVVFKYLKGKTKQVNPVDSGKMCPTFGCDSHVPGRSIASASDKFNAGELFMLSRIFLFEYDEALALTEYPSNVVPIAVLAFRNVDKDGSAGLGRKLVADQLAWSGMLRLSGQREYAFPDSRLLATYSRMKPFGLCKNLQIKQILPMEEILSWKAVKALGSSAFQGMLYKRREIKVDAIQYANYWRMTANTSIGNPATRIAFPQLVEFMRESKVAGVAFLRGGTSVVVFPSSEISSHLGIPNYPDVANNSLHCLTISYRSGITGLGFTGTNKYDDKEAIPSLATTLRVDSRFLNDFAGLHFVEPPPAPAPAKIQGNFMPTLEDKAKEPETKPESKPQPKPTGPKKKIMDLPLPIIGSPVDRSPKPHDSKKDSAQVETPTDAKQSYSPTDNIASSPGQKKINLPGMEKQTRPGFWGQPMSRDPRLRRKFATESVGTPDSEKDDESIKTDFSTNTIAIPIEVQENASDITYSSDPAEKKDVDREKLAGDMETPESPPPDGSTQSDRIIQVPLDENATSSPVGDLDYRIRPGKDHSEEPQSKRARLGDKKSKPDTSTMLAAVETLQALGDSLLEQQATSSQVHVSSASFPWIIAEMEDVIQLQNSFGDTDWRTILSSGDVGDSIADAPASPTAVPMGDVDLRIGRHPDNDIPVISLEESGGSGSNNHAGSHSSRGNQVTKKSHTSRLRERLDTALPSNSPVVSSGENTTSNQIGSTGITTPRGVKKNKTIDLSHLGITGKTEDQRLLEKTRMWVAAQKFSTLPPACEKNSYEECIGAECTMCAGSEMEKDVNAAEVNEILDGIPCFENAHLHNSLEAEKAEPACMLEESNKGLANAFSQWGAAARQEVPLPESGESDYFQQQRERMAKVKERLDATEKLIQERKHAHFGDLAEKLSEEKLKPLNEKDKKKTPIDSLAEDTRQLSEWLSRFAGDGGHTAEHEKPRPVHNLNDFQSISPKSDIGDEKSHSSRDPENANIQAVCSAIEKEKLSREKSPEDIWDDILSLDVNDVDIEQAIAFVDASMDLEGFTTAVPSGDHVSNDPSEKSHPISAGEQIVNEILENAEKTKDEGLDSAGHSKSTSENTPEAPLKIRSEPVQFDPVPTLTPLRLIRPSELSQTAVKTNEIVTDALESTTADVLGVFENFLTKVSPQEQKRINKRAAAKAAEQIKKHFKKEMDRILEASCVDVILSLAEEKEIAPDKRIGSVSMTPKDLNIPERWWQTIADGIGRQLLTIFQKKSQKIFNTTDNQEIDVLLDCMNSHFWMQSVKISSGRIVEVPNTPRPKANSSTRNEMRQILKSVWEGFRASTKWIREISHTDMEDQILIEAQIESVEERLLNFVNEQFTSCCYALREMTGVYCEELTGSGQYPEDGDHSHIEVPEEEEDQAELTQDQTVDTACDLSLKLDSSDDEDTNKCNDEMRNTYDDFVNEIEQDSGNQVTSSPKKNQKPKSINASRMRSLDEEMLAIQELDYDEEIEEIEQSRDDSPRPVEDPFKTIADIIAAESADLEAILGKQFDFSPTENQDWEGNHENFESGSNISHVELPMEFAINYVVSSNAANFNLELDRTLCRAFEGTFRSDQAVGNAGRGDLAADQETVEDSQFLSRIQPNVDDTCEILVSGIMNDAGREFRNSCDEFIDSIQEVPPQEEPLDYDEEELFFHEDDIVEEEKIPEISEEDIGFKHLNSLSHSVLGNLPSSLFSIAPGMGKLLEIESSTILHSLGTVIDPLLIKHGLIESPEEASKKEEKTFSFVRKLTFQDGLQKELKARSNRIKSIQKATKKVVKKLKRSFTEDANDILNGYAKSRKVEISHSNVCGPTPDPSGDGSDIFLRWRHLIPDHPTAHFYDKLPESEIPAEWRKNSSENVISESPPSIEDLHHLPEYNEDQTLRLPNMVPACGILIPDEVIFNRANADDVRRILEAFLYWKQMGTGRWVLKLHSQVVLGLASSKKNLDPDSHTYTRLSSILRNLTEFRKYGVVELLENHVCDASTHIPGEYLPCVIGLKKASVGSTRICSVFLSNLDRNSKWGKDFTREGVFVMNIQMFIDSFIKGNSR